MTTRRQIVSRLRKDLVEHFDDSNLYNRHLWNSFWSAAKLLLQREADAAKLVSQNVFTPYSLDTEEVDLYADTCVPIECISCRVKIPELLMSKDGMIYSFFGSPDMSIKYNIVGAAEFAMKSKVKGISSRFAFLEGNYLYLSKCLPCVKLLAIADGPAAPPAGKCSILDTEIGLPDFLVEGAIAIAKESLTATLSKRYDQVPNKNPNS